LRRGITGNTGRRLHVNHSMDIELSCCLKIDVCPLPKASLLGWTLLRGGHRRGKFCFTHFAEVPGAFLESNNDAIFIISNSIDRKIRAKIK